MSNSTEEEPRKKRLLSDTDGEESNAESVKKPKQGESLPQEATKIDDNQNSNSNPSNSEVIPTSSEDYPELQKMNANQLLEAYRVNQSKCFKVEHHIHFLEQSLKQCKIPKGLQINKEYQVIDESEDFKASIREIIMNAEIETVQAIIDHYKELFSNLDFDGTQLHAPSLFCGS